MSVRTQSFVVLECALGHSLPTTLAVALKITARIPGTDAMTEGRRMDLICKELKLVIFLLVWWFPGELARRTMFVKNIYRPVYYLLLPGTVDES